MLQLVRKIVNIIALDDEAEDCHERLLALDIRNLLIKNNIHEN